MRVLAFRTFEDPDTGTTECLLWHEAGRLVLEGPMPYERALDQGRLYTDGRTLYFEREGRYRSLVP